ncbi:thiamine pyrophosphate-requiring protein [Alkalilacustris brevis]|uniref:thiamine pyrophosphate-requiring protein n=1 Tax=Alkalilacustris brevis TaxID=2026338 RepID=UPI000E0DEC43|nr:thiamine pyrophosphate-requiring protein [Alkalilacustris brevis]
MPRTGASALLRGLRSNGIKRLFVNSGSDFAPVIEEYAAAHEDADEPFPEPILCAHEALAVGMAHGAWLASGETQAVMVHVNVGLANAAMGVINARSDDVPLVIMSGRTPFTEHNRLGARGSLVQYGQEMADQTALVRESVKWSAELVYAEQAETMASRAVAIANSHPTGPVYLSLPREPLCETLPEAPDPVASARPLQVSATAPAPDTGAVGQAARLLARAEVPLVIAQRGDRAGRAGIVTSRMAHAFGLAVHEAVPTCNLLAGDDPMRVMGQVAEHVAAADVILAIDAPVPWLESSCRVGPEKTVIHIGSDPLHIKLPMRSFRTDLAICGDVVATLEALETALGHAADRAEVAAAAIAERRAAITARHKADRDTMAARAARGTGSPMSIPWIGKCLSERIDRGTLLFSERGPTSAHLDLRVPGQLFSVPYSGGLGWGLPAALGAQLAAPDRLVVALVGDGSYLFANPVACHQVASHYQLPVLMVLLNNGSWNAVRTSTLAVYPDGAAARSNRMPMTAFAPPTDYCAIARAAGGAAFKVQSGAELPEALDRALTIIRQERRHVLLDLSTDLANPKMG